MDFDDWQDSSYRRLINGPNTSDYGRAIWAAHREQQNPSEPEPSISDLIGAQKGPPDATGVIGPVRSHQTRLTRHRSCAGRVGTQGQSEPAREDTSHALIRQPRTSCHHSFGGNARTPGARRQMTPCPSEHRGTRSITAIVEEAVRKRRYRARLKAKKKELEQMLGLRPIEPIGHGRVSASTRAQGQIGPFSAEIASLGW
jgi:hypothetical protein